MAVRNQEHPSPQPPHPPQAIRISWASPLVFFFPTHGPIRSNGGEARKQAKRKTLWRHHWEWRERSRGWTRWWKWELTGGVTLGAPCSESSWTGMPLPHTGSSIQWVMNTRNWTLTHTYTHAWLILMPPDTCTQCMPCKCVASHAHTQLCSYTCRWRKKTWMCGTEWGNCTSRYAELLSNDQNRRAILGVKLMIKE